MRRAHRVGLAAAGAAVLFGGAGTALASVTLPAAGDHDSPDTSLVAKQADLQQLVTDLASSSQQLGDLRASIAQIQTLLADRDKQRASSAATSIKPGNAARPAPTSAVVSSPHVAEPGTSTAAGPTTSRAPQPSPSRSRTQSTGGPDD